MPLPGIREFKLAEPKGDGRHAYANKDGAFIGRGVPLLERDVLGRWQPRDSTVLERLFAQGYGIPVELGWRATQLRYVAHALNKGNLALACLSLVRAELPPLPSADRARAMAKADGLLLKFNPDWAEEPRVPGGEPGHGEWTTGGGGDANGLRLSPGHRIDELGDVLEWIADAKPEDAVPLRREIKRLYYDVGDIQGGDALNRALSNVLEPGASPQDRQAVLKDYEPYTRSDPAEVAQFGRDLISGALLSPLGVLPEAETPVASGVWTMGWAARRRAIEQQLGVDLLPPNFPAIDSFANGVATSIKSIDLNAGVYQNAGRLVSRINKYVDQLADFESSDLVAHPIEPEEIASRKLILAVPGNAMTAGQRAAIDTARVRAAKIGVKINVIIFW